MSLSLREVKFGEQEFLITKPTLDIKYNHFSSLNDNLFHVFNNQSDYAFANYFAVSNYERQYRQIFV